MKVFPSFEGSSSRDELKKYLEENKLAFSFNRNPERFISKSITPTNLQNYLTCPHCFFESKKKTIKIPNQKEYENIANLCASVPVAAKSAVSKRFHGCCAHQFACAGQEPCLAIIRAFGDIAQLVRAQHS